MPRDSSDPLLLTPGPVSVSRATREAMMRDRAGWSPELEEQIRFSRAYMTAIMGGGDAYAAIPVPGSATYANEAIMATLVAPRGKVLVHTNGVYGDRLIEIAGVLGCAHAVIRTAPFTPPTGDDVAQALQADAAVTHVMMVHCETSTGILNPLEDIAAVCLRFGKGFLVDAVASFGAVPIDAIALGLQAVSVSSNKCLQGVPGLGWAVVQRAALEQASGTCRSLSLDLYDQNQHMDRTNTFRFTPPTHVLAAFAQALHEHEAEGGVPARLTRYRRNWQRLVDGMRQMGFVTVVPDVHASPIVATFHNPDDPAFDFTTLYQGMEQRGFIIFPGRLALENTFRIGCMGDVTEADIGEALAALADTLAAMGVATHGRASAEEAVA
ncbi:MAG: 2-aminoethylphosphonate--pyruvate transaminase [Janthinobacterium lividum]